ncbi:LamG-like jellyroll fold domain-containing protein, partial [Candidatus Margulisiibacteriota bacterium]
LSRKWVLFFKDAYLIRDPAYANGTGNILIQPNFNANDVFHFAFCWDASGIEGTAETARMYVDGELVATSHTQIHTDFTFSGLTIGSRYNSVENFSGVLDNVKLWSYAKTDYSDRFYEGFAIDTTPPTISSILTPTENDTDVPTNSVVAFVVTDNAWGVASETITVEIDGITYQHPTSTITIGGDQWEYYVTVDLIVDLGRGETIQVTINADDITGNAMITKKYSFTTYAYPGPMDGIRLWNKLGSEAEVTSSVVGPDGVIVGTITYETAKYDNGFRPLGDYSHKPEFDSSILNSDMKGTIEMWWKADEAHDDTSPGTKSSNLMMLWNPAHNLGSQIPADQYGMWIRYLHGTTRFNCQLSSSVFSVSYYGDSGFSWGAGDLVHVAFVWDREGIGGTSETAQLYVNDQKIATSDTAIPDDLTPVVSAFAVGNSKYNYSSDAQVRGALDNIKVWNYAKTDFSDRFYEGFAPDTTAPTVNIQSPTEDTTEVPTNSVVAFTVTDNAWGVASETITVEIDGITYVHPTSTITISGDQWEYYVTVDPIVDLGRGETIQVTINADDLTGNAMVTKNYSFTTYAYPGPMDGIRFWNKLGSEAEVISSVIGVDGVIQGTITYDPVKFGDGANFDNNANNTIKVDNLFGSDPYSSFTIEFWTEIVAPSSADYVFMSWSANPTAWADPRGYLSVNGVSGTSIITGLWMADGVDNRASYYWNLSIYEGQVVHLAYVVDLTKGSGQKVSLYVNGVDQGTRDSGTDDAISGSYTFPEYVRIGNETTPSGWTFRNLLDNFKVFNYAKTDFSDRFYEGFAPDTIPPTISVISTPTENDTDVPTDSVVAFTVTDNAWGVASETITVEIDGITYVHPTSTITISGDQWEYYVTVDPIVDLDRGETIQVTINADDVTGNAMVTKNYSFTTYAYPGLMDGIRLWNRLGSDAQVTGSEVGVNGSISGGGSGTYASVKHGNGIYGGTGDGSAKSGTLVMDDAFNTGLGTIEFWAKPTYSYDDSAYHDFLDGYKGSVVGADGNFEIRHHNDNTMHIFFYSPPGSGSAPYSEYIFTIDDTWSANEVIHMAVSFDKDAGAESKIKLYINGNAQTFSSAVSDQTWTAYDADITSGYYSPDVYIDNIKIYNYAKTDFSDRFYEGFAPDTTPPTVSIVTPTEDATSVPTNSVVAFTITDNAWGVASESITVEIDGVTYQHPTAAMTIGGDQWSYSVTVDPLSDFEMGDTIEVTINADDITGNAMITKNYSFTTYAYPGPMDGIRLWNKLGSAAEVTSSMVGPEGVINGAVDYSNVKFNGGMRGNANGEYADFAMGDFTNNEQGVVEFWIKPSFDLTNGNAQDAADHWLIEMCKADQNAYYCDFRVVDTGAQGIQFNFSGLFSDTGTDISWTAGDIVHIAGVWDRNGNLPDGANIALYVDGELAATASGTLNDNIYHQFSVGARGYNGYYPANAYIDNIKAYAYAKTDFSDRFYEGFAPDTIPPTISSILTPTENDTDVPTNSVVAFVVTDNAWGVASESIVVEIDGIIYQHPTAAMTIGGDEWEYYVTVDPVADFENGDTIQVTINASDITGNAMVTKNYSFTTYAYAGPMDGIRLWNRLGSDAQVSASDIGLNGAWDGSSIYHPGKFGSAAYSGDSNNRVKFASFPSSLINDFNKFTIEFWFRTDWSCNAGVPSDGDSHYFMNYYGDSTNRLRWGVDMGVGHELTFDVMIGGIWYIHRGYKPNWAASTDVHMAIVVDNEGIEGGSDKFRVYIDGAEITSGETGGLTTWNAELDLEILVHHTIGSYLQPWDGVMDNIKIFNYAKTDFSDRFYEGFAPDTTPPTVNIVSPTEDAVSVATSSVVSFTITDNAWGVASETITVEIDGITYQHPTAAMTIGGNEWEYTVTVDPVSDFDGGDTIEVTINAADLTGNAMITKNYSFTTYALPGPMDGIRLWNKLDSDNDVQNSVIGPDGSWTGTSEYVAGKFVSGSYSDLSNDFIEFPQYSGFVSYRGTHEFWTKLDWSLNGNTNAASDAKNHTWIMYKNGSAPRLWLYVWTGYGITITYDNSNYIFTGITLNAGQLYHMAMVIDKDGIDVSGDTIRLYIDGESRGSTDNVCCLNWNSNKASSSTQMFLCYCTHHQNL